jgi:hypothetical protein
MNNTPPFDNDYEKRVQQAYASIGIKQPARMAAGGVVEDTGGMLSAAARGIKPKLSAEDEAYFNAHNQYATDFTAYSDAYNKWADDWNAGRTEAGKDRLWRDTDIGSISFAGLRKSLIILLIRTLLGRSKTYTIFCSAFLFVTCIAAIDLLWFS